MKFCPICQDYFESSNEIFSQCKLNPQDLCHYTWFSSIDDPALLTKESFVLPNLILRLDHKNSKTFVFEKGIFGTLLELDLILKLDWKLNIEKIEKKLNLYIILQ